MVLLVVISLPALPTRSFPVQGDTLFAIAGRKPADPAVCPVFHARSHQVAPSCLAACLPLGFSPWAVSDLLTRGLCVVPLTWRVSDRKLQLPRSRTQTGERTKSKVMAPSCPGWHLGAPAPPCPAWLCLALGRVCSHGTQEDGHGVSLLR